MYWEREGSVLLLGWAVVDDVVVSSTVTGIFCEAAVEGLRSWVGEGARLMEADWMVDASSIAGFEAIVRDICGVEGGLLEGRWRKVQ